MELLNLLMWPVNDFARLIHVFKYIGQDKVSDQDFHPAGSFLMWSLLILGFITGMIFGQPSILYWLIYPLGILVEGVSLVSNLMVWGILMLIRMVATGLVIGGLLHMILT